VNETDVYSGMHLFVQDEYISISFCVLVDKWGRIVCVEHVIIYS
jgi:hypothetical protein